MPRWSSPRPERGPPSSRLAAAAGLVPAGSIVADVGTDAATLPLALLETGAAARCIATDRSAAGFDAASRRGLRHVAAGRLVLRCGEGLSALAPADAVDVLALCGLGARTILGILGDPRLAALGLRRLVLQPQTEPALVRRWLFDHGFTIVAEVLVREREHDYVVIAAEPGRTARAGCDPDADAELLLEAGPCLLASSDPLVADHWRRELRRQERILTRGAAGPGRARALRGFRLARRVLDRLARNARSGR